MIESISVEFSRASDLGVSDTGRSLVVLRSEAMSAICAPVLGAVSWLSRSCRDAS